MRDWLGMREFALAQPSGSDKAGRGRKQSGPSTPNQPNQPGWVQGLRQLYNSVLNEPLPDSFDDLLRKLDRNGHDRP
jgi:hypothetical protein